MLNLGVQVSALVRSRADFGTTSQIEQVTATTFQPAPCAVSATLSVGPTLTLTNALPFPINLTLFEAWPAAAGESAAAAPPPPLRDAAAAADEAAPPLGQRGRVAASVTAEEWLPGLPAAAAPRAALLAASSPVWSQVWPPRRRPRSHRFESL